MGNCQTPEISELHKLKLNKPKLDKGWGFTLKHPIRNAYCIKILKLLSNTSCVKG